MLVVLLAVSIAWSVKAADGYQQVSADEAAGVRGGACFVLKSVTKCSDDQVCCPVVNGFWTKSTGGQEDTTSNTSCGTCQTNGMGCGFYSTGKEDCGS
jgi:hypothetical protein